MQIEVLFRSAIVLVLSLNFVEREKTKSGFGILFYFVKIHASSCSKSDR